MKLEFEKDEREFFERNSELLPLQGQIRACVAALSQVEKPNKVMVCGNGGSCSDSQHIVGELMKEFMLKREADAEFKNDFAAMYPSDTLVGFLQGAVPAISLTGESALMTAVINDIGAQFLYAQQVYGLGTEGDVFIGISTSGNAPSIIAALKTARALNITTIGMTGETGGKMGEYCDILLNVPQTETYKVQELHLPLYHYLCAAVERERWGK